MSDALLLSIFSGGVAGVLVGLLFAWRVRRRLWHLELDLSELETRFVSEVKKRAAGERWKGKDQVEELKEILAARQQGNTQPKSWMSRFDTGKKGAAHGLPK